MDILLFVACLDDDLGGTLLGGTLKMLEGSSCVISRRKGDLCSFLAPIRRGGGRIEGDCADSSWRVELPFGGLPK